MKRFERLLLCIFCVLLLLGCAREPEAVVIDVTGGSASPASSGGASAPEEASPASGRPKLKLRDTAAYAFEGAEGPGLYGAAAYENTGDAPLRPTKAIFAFTYEGKTEEVEFVPIFAQQTIVLPGETAYAVLWYGLKDAPSGVEVSLSASIEWEAAAGQHLPIEAEGLHLAHNYPAFTTMAGVLTASADSPSNLIYTAFYDAGGKLLGVWYFTEGAYLMAGEPKAFTSHLREFPLADLAEHTAEIRTFGFGMS